MRVIHSAPLGRRPGLGTLLPAIGLLLAGAAAAAGAFVVAPTSGVAGLVFGVAAAIGVLGGIAALVIARRPDAEQAAVLSVESLLRDAFDDAYTLVLWPRLPIARRVRALLVGPAGVRVILARDWVGRYRVRGRAWEFDPDGRDAWVPCGTNPSLDVAALVDGVSRWATTAGFHVPVTGVVAFPRRRCTVVLEEPEDEVVTTQNVPWWANRIGRVQRLDAAHAASFLAAVVEAAEEPR
jgi:hypothetical protein